MIRKVISSVLSLLLVLSLVSLPAYAAETGGVFFVTELYDSALGRVPDQTGLEKWASELDNRKTTGAGVAYGVLFSEEFKSKGLDDEAFVDVLYRALLGREADEAGRDEHVRALKSGLSRTSLFGNFIDSREFHDHCSRCGIAGGTYIEGKSINTVTRTSLFIDRLYNRALGREADREGLRNWTVAVVNGSRTGADIAYGFLFSVEYTERNKDDERFVTDLYNTLLDREPDGDGMRNWLDMLGNGYTREYVFEQFVNSPEFTALCSDYGMVRGNFKAATAKVVNEKTEEAVVDPDSGIDLFVDRLYSIVLGRKADKEGMANWTNSLAAGTNTGSGTAYGFFFSEEYLMRDKSNEEFITDLYNVMLDRGPDGTGMAHWLGRLEKGYPRRLIFAGLANSAEFTDICKSYGIVRGDYSYSGWSFDDNNNKVYIRNSSKVYGWASIDGGYYFFDRKTGILATDTRINEISVDHDGRAEDTEYARQKIPVMMKAREILLSITTPEMSVYEKQMACCNYVMPMPYLMKDYTVGRHANDWACITAHYANNLLNAYGDQKVQGGECFAEACALGYLFNEIDEGQVYIDRDEMHGWVEMNGIFWDPLFAESRGRNYLNMDPKNYEYQKAPVQYPL